MTEAEANELAADIVYRLHKAAQNENIKIPLVLSDGLYLDVKAALLAASRPREGFIRTHEGEDLRVLGTLPVTADGCVAGDGAKLWTTEGAEWKVYTFASEDPAPIEFDPSCGTDELYSTREAASAAKGVGDA